MSTKFLGGIIISKKIADGKRETAEVFENKSEISIGNQVYIVQRHFTGKREVKEAINTMVLNSLKLENSSEKTA